MNEALFYRRKIYTNNHPKGVVFFACPFGVKRWALLWVVKRICSAGFTVVVYDFDNRILFDKNLSLLPQTIYNVNKDISRLIKEYELNGQSNFGIFGTSLGSFVLFSAVANNVKIAWGVFNTAGNAARGTWNIPYSRKRLRSHGFTLESLESAWTEVQNPEFKSNDTLRYFLFIGSNKDEVVPLGELEQYMDGMKKTGIKTEIREYSNGRHLAAAFKGLWHADSLVLELNSRIQNRN